MRTLALVAAALVSSVALADSKPAVVTPPAYQEECGSCHIAYPPRFLGPSAWHRVMQAKCAFRTNEYLPKRRRGGEKMKSIKFVIFVACAHWSAFAQEAGTNRIVLTPELINEFAEEARSNNAALWAARSRVTAAAENASRAATGGGRARRICEWNSGRLFSR